MINGIPKEFYEFGGSEDEACDIFWEESEGVNPNYEQPQNEANLGEEAVATEEFKDDSFSDIDFSQFTGDFKSSLKKINKGRNLEIVPKRVIVPGNRPVIVQGKQKKVQPNRPILNRQNKHDGTFEGKRKYFLAPGAGTHSPIENKKSFGVNRSATIIGKPGQKTTSKIIVPDDREVIVQGVSKFIVSHSPKDDAIRNIGYYEGKRLKEVVLIFVNDGLVDFNLELFNPSMPLDYTQSTSLNLNDRISVAGNNDMSYSDLCYGLLANPALFVNAKFTFSGPQLTEQIAQPLFFKNKEITGKEKIQPLQMPLMIDTMQFANNIVFFDVAESLNRPFIPDGLDVIQYKVLPGMTVTFAFFVKQIQLKKLLFKEARAAKGLL